MTRGSHPASPGRDRRLRPCSGLHAITGASTPPRADQMDDSRSAAFVRRTDNLKCVGKRRANETDRRLSPPSLPSRYVFFATERVTLRLAIGNRTDVPQTLATAQIAG